MFNIIWFFDTLKICQVLLSLLLPWFLLLDCLFLINRSLKSLVWKWIRMLLFNSGTLSSWHFAGLTSFQRNDYIYCTSITWHNQNKASLIEQYLMINTFPWNFPSLPSHFYIDKWCSFTLMFFSSKQKPYCPVTASCWIHCNT